MTYDILTARQTTAGSTVLNVLWCHRGQGSERAILNWLRNVLWGKSPDRLETGESAEEYKGRDQKSEKRMECYCCEYNYRTQRSTGREQIGQKGAAEGYQQNFNVQPIPQEGVDRS